MIPLQPVILSLANRCRGGLISIKSGQLGRLLFWAIPLALTLTLTRHPESLYETFWYFLQITVASYIGSCIAAWGKYDTIPTAWDPANLTLQGILFLWPTAIIVLAFFNYAIAAALALSAFTIAPCYWLGWHIPSKLKGFETGIPIAELIFGFIIGLSIYIGGLL